MKNTDIEVTVMKQNLKMLAGTVKQLADQNSDLYEKIKAAVDFSPGHLESIQERQEQNTAISKTMDVIIAG